MRTFSQTWSKFSKWFTIPLAGLLTIAAILSVIVGIELIALYELGMELLKICVMAAVVYGLGWIVDGLIREGIYTERSKQ